jgi:hypothetical protein
MLRRRDFPPDQIPPLSAISGNTATPAEGQRTDMASYLNPWLARHAVLVCSSVKARSCLMLQMSSFPMLMGQHHIAA